jgi:hypothetical protein
MASDGKTESGWVRVMCDHMADGVWSRNGAMDADDLPVPAPLVARIRAWQLSFEHLPDEIPPERFEAFCVEGLDIARSIKSHLPDWTVIYHDPRRYPPEDADPGEIETHRKIFEYEVLP